MEHFGRGKVAAGGLDVAAAVAAVVEAFVGVDEMWESWPIVVVVVAASWWTRTMIQHHRRRRHHGHRNRSNHRARESSTAAMTAAGC